MLQPRRCYRPFCASVRPSARPLLPTKLRALPTTSSSGIRRVKATGHLRRATPSPLRQVCKSGRQASGQVSDDFDFRVGISLYVIDAADSTGSVRRHRVKIDNLDSLPAEPTSAVGSELVRHDIDETPTSAKCCYRRGLRNSASNIVSSLC